MKAFMFIQDLKPNQKFKFKNSNLEYIFTRFSNGYCYYVCLNNGYSYDSSILNQQVIPIVEKDFNL